MLSARVAIMILLALSAVVLFAGGADTNLEGQLRNRLEGFFEATLNGDVVALDDYISDSCSEKAEFLELVGSGPAFEGAIVEVPNGAFSFDVDGDVAVAKRSAESEPVLVNGEALEDDPTNDIPLKFVDEGGVWQVMNCYAYVSE